MSFIEHTEAMHVIDVNSGPKWSKETKKKQLFLCQFRSWRRDSKTTQIEDIGGLIIIDFIDMRTSENKSQLIQ